MGPQNLKLASEISEGILLPIYSPFRDGVFFGDLCDKFGEGKAEVAPFVPVCIGDDVKSCIDKLRAPLAFWVGGMGAKGLNFYNNYARRLGFEEAAIKVQQHYVSGRRGEAAMALPDDFVDEVSLCGPPARIKDRLDAWRESACTTMILTGVSPEAATTMAELVA
jgi:alkanesulfonate monooxygenase SsuD/methylene tetrahydromethanopterin reductase-like flavin-dependent oxidoreductase (luciferase family)